MPLRQAPSAPPSPTPPAPSSRAQDAAALAEQRALRALGDRFLQVVREKGARRVLIVSARAGDGRSRVARALVEDLAPRLHGGVQLLDQSALRTLDPSCIEGDLLTIVDGPALLDGRGALDVPDAWWSALDGAVVVALAHESSRDDLAAVAELLEVRGVPRLALVWNEREHPPLAVLLRGLWGRARRALRLGTGDAKTPAAVGPSAVHPRSGR